MKIKFGIFDAVPVAAIGIIFLTGCTTPSTTNTDEEQSINGTNLKLVGKYQPFHLYIYADTASTNKFPDYAIFKGHEPVLLLENESNTVETTHFENGFSVLETKRDDNGRILKRYMNYDDDLGRQIYSYIDTNGDGLFDVLIKFGTNGERSSVFVRSNLCWVPRFGKK
jgi:hypothetical protein